MKNETIHRTSVSIPDPLWERAGERGVRDGFQYATEVVVDLLDKYGRGQIYITARQGHDLAKMLAEKIGAAERFLDGFEGDVPRTTVRQLLADLQPDILAKQVDGNVEMVTQARTKRQLRCPMVIWQAADERRERDGFEDMPKLIIALLTRYAAGGIPGVAAAPEAGPAVTLAGRVTAVLMGLDAVYGQPVPVVRIRGQLNDVHPKVLTEELVDLHGRRLITLSPWTGGEPMPPTVEACGVTIDGQKLHMINLAL